MHLGLLSGRCLERRIYAPPGSLAPENHHPPASEPASGVAPDGAAAFRLDAPGTPEIAATDPVQR